MSEVMSPVVHQDLTIEQLMNAAIERGEAVVCANGALSVNTGKRTGRSPKDRFIVQDDRTESSVDWGAVNQPMSPTVFASLWQAAEAYMAETEHFVSHLHVGADEKQYLPVQVASEFAWHNLFVRHLFIRPDNYNPSQKPAWQIINATNMDTRAWGEQLTSEAVVAIDFSGRRVLLCGTAYAGEMKKAMFTVLNYFLPADDILPMHCAANEADNGDVALFFGLSGTGKTTLSADPMRRLIGDDEHGWSAEGVFNFEGGCYAKCINLSQEREPVIWQAIRSGALMENVVLDSQGQADFSDTSLTQNTRAAYPREHIAHRVLSNQGQVPSSVIFLTCDLFGVLPPVARLSKEQAAYYFLSGYTALVGSTEFGAKQGVTPTFSTCFGAPFFPRKATVYAELLMKRIVEAGSQVYLVNTGWTGGAYGAGGQRFSLPVTRAIIDAIHRGELATCETHLLPGFDLSIPAAVTGVESNLLDPRKVWCDAAEYRATLTDLIRRFQDNFARFEVSDLIVQAGPSHLE
jgi:phosphoenolpyruvate carboxykinase (ATP)